MKAILKKTVSSKFRAGDVILGESRRIKRLVDSDIAIKDSSLLAVWGALFAMITSALIIIFLITLAFPIVSKYIPFEVPFIWTATIIPLMLLSFSLNMAYFLNGKRPYATYFLGFVTNVFSGIFVMVGHETMAWKYQNKNIAATAALTQIILGLIGASAIALALVDINFDVFYTINGFANVWMYAIFMSAFALSMTLGGIYDNKYTARRKSYISFLRKTNAKIEYKTKALNAYKAYLKSGNAEKFLEQNVDLLEETLKRDRERIKK